MDQPEKETSGVKIVDWIQCVVLAGFLVFVEARLYLLLRLWAGEITGAQIAYKDVPPSGPSNPLIYITLLSVLLIAVICYKRARWLTVTLLLSIPIAFTFMSAV
jgi:hypothetical protein